MIDTLFPYCTDSVPERLTTALGLADKVDDDGKLRLYPGNTVVFLLDEGTKQRLAELQDGLYHALDELGMLAERLDPSAFHMTLHDLANPSLGADWMEQKVRMDRQARQVLCEIRSLEPQNLRMRATYAFQMVRTSIVLGLEPVDSETAEKLDALYERFQGVRRLGYAMTPHITLAYFVPGDYAGKTVAKLRDALGPVWDFEMVLNTRQLVLQEFLHMNCYTTVEL